MDGEDPDGVEENCLDEWQLPQLLLYYKQMECGDLPVGHFLGNRVLWLTLHRRSLIDFGLRCMFPTWSDWRITYTRKGLRNNTIQRGMQLILFSLLIVGIYGFYRSSGISKILFHDGGLYLHSSLAHVLDHLSWVLTQLRQIIVKN